MGSSPLQYPTLDSSIANLEGFGKPGTLATKDNNPGNLVAGPFSTAHGATGQNGDFAVFPDVATGLGAEDALIGRYDAAGYNIQDLIQKWAPPTAPGNSPEATQQYIDNLSKSIGVSPYTPIGAAEAGATTTPATKPDPNKITAGDVLGAILNPMVGGTNLAMKSEGLGGLSWSRIAAFSLGLIFIAGGLYLFKPVQQVVNSTVKGAVAAV